MKILSIETSAVAAGCAVCEDGKILCEGFVNVKLTHSQTLLTLTESVLHAACIDISDIDLFAVAAGPGSFTGVRIGVAAVKGMAYAGNKECVAVSSLEALAYNLAACEDCIVCPVMDARCSQVYNAVFLIKDGIPTRLCEDRALSVEDLSQELKKNYKKPIFLVGDGANMCYNSMKSIPTVFIAPENSRYQRASSVALAAQRLYADGHTLSPAELRPFYLRPPQAEKNLKIKKESEQNVGTGL